MDLRPALAATPVLFVGVGYGAGFGSPAIKRGRDYTPVAHGDEPGSGGADAFLQFLTVTLWPVLARRYPAPPRFVALGKPQPAIFEEARRRVGGGRLLMVGDSLETDVAGARAVGLDAALVV